MLTKSDLSEIRIVVKNEVKRFTTKDDLKTLATKNDLKPIKSDIAKIRKDIDAMLSMLDREYVELRKRVERLEEHLNLPPLPPQI